MAKKNYYAVKKGYHTGIFETWAECQKEISGFSGAEFKGFTRREDAEQYLHNFTPNHIIQDDENIVTAYVDGSFNEKTGCYGCGVVIFHCGKEKEFSQSWNNPEMATMRNVAGEIEGAKLAMEYCFNHDIQTLNLYFDYEGIEKWCTGAWKTKKTGTMEYKQIYNKISKKVKINFIKVKGHSGDKYNDKADALAKEACGVI